MPRGVYARKPLKLITIACANCGKEFDVPHYDAHRALEPYHTVFVV